MFQSGEIIQFLAHPKTVAFVSHIGLNSLNEAVHFGIPLVAVPFFGQVLPV
jgi:UDP:flavonoid glycosyltransferase YjiC (YdhE family)